MSTTLFVCDTCNYTEHEKYIGNRTGGEMLYEHVLNEAYDSPDLIIERFSCLMNCKRHCSVALSAPGKTSYVLGQFEPTNQHARAIIEYAELYTESETGQVPYKNWPQDIKGRFTARIPPMLDVDDYYEE